METQPQNPEFRINPENFHPCECIIMTVKNKTIQAQCLPILFSTKIFPTMANNKI